MSTRQHLPYPLVRGGGSSRSVLEAVERLLVLTGTLCMIGGLGRAAMGCLLLALACLLPSVAVPVKRAVWPSRRGRHVR